MDPHYAPVLCKVALNLISNLDFIRKQALRILGRRDLVIRMGNIIDS